MQDRNDATIFEFTDLFTNLDVGQDVPNLRHLSNIELKYQGADAEKNLTDDDKNKITDSVSAIEKSADLEGFDPLLIDFSLIMDNRYKGEVGHTGWYHSFYSVNTIEPDAVADKYISSIYREHRSRGIEPYESIVTHTGLFSSDTSAIVFGPEQLRNEGLRLPAFKDVDHVGAYRFDVKYVEQHAQNVVQNTAKFLTNFSQEMAGLASNDASHSRDYLLVVPFRRAQFRPVGQLKDYTNPKLGSPGGAMFIFLRCRDVQSGQETRAIRRFLRRVTWLLSHAAVGEAVGPSQQRVEQLDRATSVYGMAHPLKHRWNEMRRTVEGVKGELNTDKTVDLEAVKKRVRTLSVHTRSFGDWVELAYILYYASSLPFEAIEKRSSVFSERVFSMEKDYRLLDEFSTAESLATLVGETRAERMKISIDLERNPILIASRASAFGRAMPRAVYRQFLFEILTNARRNGRANPEGNKEIRVGEEAIHGAPNLIISNAIDEIPDEFDFALDNWSAWDSTERPGGLSFVDQILRWTESGFIRIKIDTSRKLFQTALQLNGLEFISGE